MQEKTNPNPSQDRVEELRERIRKELFGSLCHYRQHCINERDDAMTVAKFIDDEIASRPESEAVMMMREALERFAQQPLNNPPGDALTRRDMIIKAREALARIGR